MEEIRSSKEISAVNAPSPQTEGPQTERPKSTSQDLIVSHPDSSSSKKSSNSDGCFMGCLTSIKECICAFFSWLCSCFSKEEKGKKRTDREEKKSFEKPNEQLLSLLGNLENPALGGKAPPRELIELMGQTESVMQPAMKVIKEKGDEVQQRLRVRYKKLVENDQEALLYLADMIKIEDLVMLFIRAIMKQAPLGGNPLVQVTTLFAPLDEVLNRKIPSTISKKEEAATIEMIKKLNTEGPSILDPLVEDEAQCQKLLKYMNDIRKTEKLDPIKMQKKQNKH